MKWWNIFYVILFGSFIRFHQKLWEQTVEKYTVWEKDEKWNEASEWREEEKPS